MAQGQGFLYELGRRHVVRVAVAYAVAAWILLQLASIVFPVFGAPDWVLKVIIALLILGFPLALLLAWAFELTPEGIRRTEPAHSPSARLPEQHRHVGRSLNAIVIGVLVLAVLGLLWRQFSDHRAIVQSPSALPISTASSSSTKSVAVLPFENLSEDKANLVMSPALLRLDPVWDRLRGDARFQKLANEGEPAGVSTPKP